MLRRGARTLIWLLLLAGIALVAVERWPDLVRVSGTAPPTSRMAFDSWLREDPERRREYAEFEAFLRARGAQDAVPAWQLTRIDGHYAARCNLPVFRIPPRTLWPNIVPALKLVQSDMKPVIGDVQVLSSYRTPQLNECAGGASRSNHLEFSALDMRTVDGQRGAEFYQRLCAMQDAAGPSSRMGLGAYFDAADPGYAGGRFHIDAGGYRSWGRNYRASSSPCR